jgi:hypothetical protein
MQSASPIAAHAFVADGVHVRPKVADTALFVTDTVAVHWPWPVAAGGVARKWVPSE